MSKYVRHVHVVDAVIVVVVIHEIHLILTLLPWPSKDLAHQNMRHLCLEWICVSCRNQ